MRIYLDTSFLVSLYVRDANSAQAIAAVPSQSTKILTQFGELEFCNALRLRVFRRELKESSADLIHQNFQRDLDSRVYEYHAFNPSWLERALNISRAHTGALGTRTLDIVHVACALELQADRLFTFDSLQRSLAKTLRLPVN